MYHCFAGHGPTPDLRRLAAVLILLEGHAQQNLRDGSWYYDPRINGGFNGSDLHGVPCTYVSDKLLELLIEALVFDRSVDVKRLVNDLVRSQPESKRPSVDRRAIESVIRGKFPEHLYRLVFDGKWEKRK